MAAALALLASVCALFAPFRPVTHWHGTPKLLFGGGGAKSLAFRSLDEKRAAAYLSSFASRISRWGVPEWSLFGAPPLTFSTRALPGGVRLQYFDVGSAGGALNPDGALEIVCRGGKLTLTTEPGSVSRARQERVLYALLLAEARQPLSPLGQAGELAPSLFLPDTRKEARLLAQIDSACMYDRKGQFERLKKGGR